MKKKPTGAAVAAPDDDVQVTVLTDHDHRITPGRVLAFKAGTSPWVSPDVAEALIAAGAAETMTAQTEE